MIEASFEAVVPKAINAEFEAIIPREKAFDIVNKDIHIDANGRYEVNADAGTAMTQVNVEVDIGNLLKGSIIATGSGVNSVTDVVIKDDATNISGQAFANFSKLESVYIPVNVTSIGNAAFQNCYVLKNITSLADGITSLGNYCFQGCNTLISFSLPKALKTIGVYAFSNCYAISNNMVFPKDITNIAAYVFMNCRKIPLFDFRNHESIPTLDNSNAFSGTICKFVVPDALYDQWVVATNWATYTSRIVKASEFVEPTNN